MSLDFLKLLEDFKTFLNENPLAAIFLVFLGFFLYLIQDISKSLYGKWRYESKRKAYEKKHIVPINDLMYEFIIFRFPGLKTTLQKLPVKIYDTKGGISIVKGRKTIITPVSHEHVEEDIFDSEVLSTTIRLLTTGTLLENLDFEFISVDEEKRFITNISKECISDISGKSKKVEIIKTDTIRRIDYDASSPVVRTSMDAIFEQDKASNLVNEIIKREVSESEKAEIRNRVRSIVYKEEKQSIVKIIREIEPTIDWDETWNGGEIWYEKREITQKERELLLEAKETYLSGGNLSDVLLRLKNQNRIKYRFEEIYFYLLENPGKYEKEISYETGIKYSTVTQSAIVLEKRGYLSKETKGTYHHCYPRFTEDEILRSDILINKRILLEGRLLVSDKGIFLEEYPNIQIMDGLQMGFGNVRRKLVGTLIKEKERFLLYVV